MTFTPPVSAGLRSPPGNRPFRRVRQAALSPVIAYALAGAGSLTVWMVVIAVLKRLAA